MTKQRHYKYRESQFCFEQSPGRNQTSPWPENRAASGISLVLSYRQRDLPARYSDDCKCPNRMVPQYSFSAICRFN